MAQLTIEIPDALPGEDLEEIKMEYRRGAVAKWFDMGLISSGRGAELLGIGREEFLLMLGKYGVPAIQLDPKDFDNEFGP
ncbi:hypothetical protein BH09SUM1_BH09SUM1_24060 [soil metagenome]